MTTLITSDDDDAEKMILSDEDKETDKTDKTDDKDKTVDDKQFAKDVNNNKQVQRLQSEFNINGENVVGVVRTSSESGSPLLKALKTS